MSNLFEMRLAEMLGQCRSYSIGVLVEESPPKGFLEGQLDGCSHIKLLMGPAIEGATGVIDSGRYLPNQEWDASKIQGKKELLIFGDIENLRYHMLLGCALRGVSRLIYADENTPGDLLFSTVRRSPLVVLLKRLSEVFRAGSEPLQATGGEDAEGSLDESGRNEWRGVIPLIVEAKRPRTGAEGPVLFFNNSLGWGGAERQISILLSNMDGADVRMLCNDLSSFEDRNFFLPVLQAANVEVSELDAFLNLHEEAVLSFEGEWVDLLRELQGVRSDIRNRVFKLWMALKIAKPRLVHLWQDQTNIEVGIAAVLAGVPGILMSGRNMAPFRFPYHQDYMKECYGELLKLDGVSLMNNSKAGAKDYEEWLGLEPGSVEVIYNAVDTEYLSGSQKGDEGDSAERLVSGIFRFYPEKRPLLWLKVAKQVYKAEPNTRFEIAGTGPLLDEAKEFAKENGLEGIVTFLGSTKKVKELLDRSDCLLLVSDREGLPNVILEAQSMGVPVVTSNAGGAAECLVENESGVVIRSDVRDDYVEALLKCLRDPEWLMRARETARENVEAKFRVGVSLAGFRGLYDKILAS